MKIVRGKQLLELDASRLSEILAPNSRVVIDVGTGDGAFAYRHARAHPGAFVIGVDPVRENMREWSARAARKPQRDRIPNVLYAVGSVEHVPLELHGIADEILVTLPWGSLMRGLILADDTVLAGLVSLAGDGALLRVVLNTRIFDEPVPADVRDLPELTPEYVRDSLVPAYARHGINIDEARFMDADEVAAIGTTWAKRLSHRSPPPSMLITGTIRR